MTNPVVPMPDRGADREPAQVLLQPIAAPSVLGLYGFAGATFMVAAHMAHWFGNTRSDLFLAPVAALFGGLAQFTAGMWAYKARDAVATAMHGMWGAFWIAWGILNLGFAAGWIAQPTGAFPALGFWFIILAAITWVGMWASAAENKSVPAVLFFLALGSTLAAIGELIGVDGLRILAGWSFIISALVAFYTASALMLESAYGREVLPLGKTEHARHAPRFNVGVGEPGVIRGQ